ncbi:hypothetical protein MG290_01595 [Flavobacterium sp. CBA20B-1]|uniref:hypothetical protein n=1 Tax=unclassified Flavobacterium TaxID=196869 RepID=UPI002225A6E6|nr:MULTISPECIES: hypothetical protein [unclassified Flavobacterium]WCM42389.1 hypothetical protein MG290_01595 [Flavobacterium sp. CBA20B-1]
MLSEEEKEIILYDLTKIIIDQKEEKNYHSIEDLDEEDLHRLSILQKVHPDKYLFARALIEDNLRASV